ncbi:hypothetical protein [Actinoplanes nipponensis]|uniref:hypothetical protein n=1 Tax=Actinoplanes nipponensis TaxID=135950 RepID=UPI0031EBD8B2
MVFVPAPQLTVTLEQQHDKSELHVHPGGQGVWQARMITLLGAQVTLCSGHRRRGRAGAGNPC